MSLYEKILIRLLNELNVKEPSMIKQGLIIKNEQGFEYKIAEVDDSDAENIKYVIERPGWRSAPMSYEELKKFKKD